jgi:hypothetical protein
MSDPVMSDKRGLPERLDRSWQWIAQRSLDVLAGGNTVAEESDRWFLGALRGLERGAAHAQGGVDAFGDAIAARWERIRPSWARRRTPRERIEAMLRAEGKRHGFDVKQKEFHEFSGKLAGVLELVYAGALPLEDIAFEPATEDSGSLDPLAVATEAGLPGITEEAHDAASPPPVPEAEPPLVAECGSGDVVPLGRHVQPAHVEVDASNG